MPCPPSPAAGGAVEPYSPAGGYCTWYRPAGTVVHTYGSRFCATWTETTSSTGQRVMISVASPHPPRGAPTRAPGPYRISVSMVARSG